METNTEGSCAKFYSTGDCNNKFGHMRQHDCNHPLTVSQGQPFPEITQQFNLDEHTLINIHMPLLFDRSWWKHRSTCNVLLQFLSLQKSAFFCVCLFVFQAKCCLYKNAVISCPDSCTVLEAQLSKLISNSCENMFRISNWKSPFLEVKLQQVWI